MGLNFFQVLFSTTCFNYLFQQCSQLGGSLNFNPSPQRKYMNFIYLKSSSLWPFYNNKWWSTVKQQKQPQKMGKTMKLDFFLFFRVFVKCLLRLFSVNHNDKHGCVMDLTLTARENLTTFCMLSWLVSLLCMKQTVQNNTIVIITVV